MKNKIMTLLALLTLTGTALAGAENYKPVRIELGATFPIALGDHSANGIGFVVEPKYNITDQVSAGLRAEIGALMGGDDNSASAIAFMAYLAKADYFFTTTKIRPFAAFGTGVYVLGAADASSEVTTTSVSSDSKAVAGNFWGFMPQVGVNLGGFRLATGVHFILAKEEVARASTNTETLLTSYSYEKENTLRSVLSIELSGSIMGKKK